MGPFASLFSALALIAAFLTLHLQRQELEEQRKELRATRAEMAAQTKLLERQGQAADAQAQAARAQATMAEASSFESFRVHYDALFAHVANMNGVVRANALSSWSLPDLPLCRHPFVLALALKVESAAQTCIERSADREWKEAREAEESIVTETVLDAKARLTAFHAGVRIWFAASLAGRDLSSLERAIVKNLLDDDRATRMEALLSVDDLLARRGGFDLETGESIENGLIP